MNTSQRILSFFFVSPRFSPAGSWQTLCSFYDRMLGRSLVQRSTHEVTIKVSGPTRCCILVLELKSRGQVEVRFAQTEHLLF